MRNQPEKGQGAAEQPGGLTPERIREIAEECAFDVTDQNGITYKFGHETVIDFGKAIEAEVTANLASQAQAERQPVTYLDVMSLIRQQCHRVYASAIDREEIDAKYMAEIEHALAALSATSPSQPHQAVVAAGWRVKKHDDGVIVVQHPQRGGCALGGKYIERDNIEHNIFYAFLDAMLATPAAPVDQAPVLAEPRRELYLSAINCAHSIDEDTIILHRDPAKDGNALNQLGNRLDEAFAKIAAPAAGARDQALLQQIVSLGMQIHFEGHGEDEAAWADDVMVWTQGDRMGATHKAVEQAALKRTTPAAKKGFDHE